MGLGERVAQLQKLARGCSPRPFLRPLCGTNCRPVPGSCTTTDGCLEARNQLLIMLKQSGAVLAEASAVAEDKTLAQKVYANQTHCWGATFPEQGYCPWVDIEDAAAAAKCRRDCRNQGRGDQRTGASSRGHFARSVYGPVNANINQSLGSFL